MHGKSLAHDQKKTKYINIRIHAHISLDATVGVYTYVDFLLTHVLDNLVLPGSNFHTITSLRNLQNYVCEIISDSGSGRQFYHHS